MELEWAQDEISLPLVRVEPKVRPHDVLLRSQSDVVDTVGMSSYLQKKLTQNERVKNGKFSGHTSEKTYNSHTMTPQIYLSHLSMSESMKTESNEKSRRQLRSWSRESN